MTRPTILFHQLINIQPKSRHTFKRIHVKVVSIIFSYFRNICGLDTHCVPVCTLRLTCGKTCLQETSPHPDMSCNSVCHTHTRTELRPQVTTMEEKLSGTKENMKKNPTPFHNHKIVGLKNAKGFLSSRCVRPKGDEMERKQNTRTCACTSPLRACNVNCRFVSRGQGEQEPLALKVALLQVIKTGISYKILLLLTRPLRVYLCYPWSRKLRPFFSGRQRLSSNIELVGHLQNTGWSPVFMSSPSEFRLCVPCRYLPQVCSRDEDSSLGHRKPKFLSIRWPKGSALKKN